MQLHIIHEYVTIIIGVPKRIIIMEPEFYFMVKYKHLQYISHYETSMDHDGIAIGAKHSCVKLSQQEIILALSH